MYVCVSARAPACSRLIRGFPNKTGNGLFVSSVDNKRLPADCVAVRADDADVSSLNITPLAKKMKGWVDKHQQLLETLRSMSHKRLSSPLPLSSWTSKTFIGLREK